MTAQEYIQQELRKLAEPIVLEDIGNTPLEAAIYAKVMSKKFRKLKADEDTVKIVKKAIELAVKNNQPVAFNVVFGGNKLWRLDEAPEIDWAELFSAIYFLRWMKSVASVYKPGAWLEYYSEDVVLEELNNLPKAETDQYAAGFKAMLAWLQQYIPKGVTVSYRRYTEDYDNIADYYAELKVAKAKVLDELGGKLPELSEAQKIATELNVRLRPGQDDDPLWREKVEFIHQSIERTETVERYFYDPKYIPACPTYYPGLVVTGSTKRSYVKFWVGVGALERDGDSFHDLVLSPNQLSEAKFEWEDVHLDGLVGKNFKKIRVT